MTQQIFRKLRLLSIAQEEPTKSQAVQRPKEEKQDHAKPMTRQCAGDWRARPCHDMGARARKGGRQTSGRARQMGARGMDARARPVGRARYTSARGKRTRSARSARRSIREPLEGSRRIASGREGSRTRAKARARQTHADTRARARAEASRRPARAPDGARRPQTLPEASGQCHERSGMFQIAFADLVRRFRACK